MIQAWNDLALLDSSNRSFFIIIVNIITLERLDSYQNLTYTLHIGSIYLLLRDWCLRNRGKRKPERYNRMPSTAKYLSRYASN